MNCPACGRKLLSQASARCNWCGETVPDAAFQAQATAARAEYFAHVTAHDAASLLAMEGLSAPSILPLTPALAAPRMSPSPAPREDSPGEAVTTEQDEARARFQHLEI